MDRWDVALLAIAGYVALVALIRLMLRRRDRVLGEFRRRIRQVQRRQEADQDQQQQAGERDEAA